jgi:flagellum-specific peptidoglycan hydrolase FlgJ
MALLNDFKLKFTNFAKDAANLTGVPWQVVLAQWGLESAYGTSYGALHRNNLAGIGGRSGYRVYPNIQDFISDYSSLLSRRYKAVCKAGNVHDACIALGLSPWAAHHYRLQASGDEYKGTSGIPGTEGQALLATIKRLGI